MLDVLEPDIIVINEGLFPSGPENKGHIDSKEFREKYLHLAFQGNELNNMFDSSRNFNLFNDCNVGFDFKETLNLVNQYNDRCQITLGSPNYENLQADECFLRSMTSFGFDLDSFVELEPNTGDIIFTLEPDAFLFEGDKEVIQEEISKLKPGQGLKCMWRDFLETQFYCEAINEVQPKHRRFCYCWDNLENYRQAIDGFMSQSYPKLQFTDKFWIRHYPWFVHDKWKELRYELIYRSDPKYWKDFEKGLNTIRTLTQEYLEHSGLISQWKTNTPGKHWDGWKVEMRPSRQDEGRWAKFIDVEHPKHIQSHPNYVK